MEDAKLILLHVQSSDETPCYYIGDKQRIAYIRIGNEKKIIDAYKRYEQFPNYRAPEFTSNASEFHVTLWNLNYEQFLKDVTKDGKEFLKEGKEFLKEETKYRKEFLKAQRGIYKIILLDPHATIAQMAAKLSLSDRQIRNYLKRLADMNLIVREGGRKAGIWRIVDADFDSFFAPE